MQTISATGRTTPVRFQGRAFNVVIATDPAGSTLKLQFSLDGGTTWYDYQQDNTLVTWTGEDFDYIRNLSDFQWALNCTTYGGTPFVAGLVGV